MSEDTVHVVIIGHSYVRRLGQFIRDNVHSANLGLDHNQVTVHCFGLGGGSFRAGVKCIGDYVHAVMTQLEFTAKIVFLHVGENDLTSANPDSIVENLQHLIHQLSTVYNVPITVVSQLMPFPVHDQRRSSVIAVNMALEHTYRTNPNVLYWKHRGGFWNPTRNLYLHDNVHLNSIGQLSYSRSVHRAVKTAMQMLTSFGN